MLEFVRAISTENNQRKEDFYEFKYKILSLNDKILIKLKLN